MAIRRIFLASTCKRNCSKRSFRFGRRELDRVYRFHIVETLRVGVVTETLITERVKKKIPGVPHLEQFEC